MLELSRSKIIINKQVLKNRIVASPVSINKANEDGTVSENIISYFSNLAKNEISMVTIGAVSVSKEGRDTINGMMIGEDKFDDGLVKLSSSIKKYGAKACLQLFHVGAQGNTKLSNERLVGPSEYVVPDIGIQCEVLTKNEIEKIENDFVRGILKAYKAGFDFIEIHMAHGYLLHQFLSPYLNKREDEYGGSEENRLRIIKNIFKKLEKYNFIDNIGARVTGDDFLDNGLNIKKIKNLINFLDSKKICYYSVTAGIYETAKQKYINMKKGSYWDYSRELKLITSTPVIAQGNIMTLNEGELILKEKKGDMYSMAQALIADPRLVIKTFNNQENEVFNCLAHIKIGSCHRCRYVKQKDHSFDCVTPSAWRPIEEQSSKKKKDISFWKKTIETLRKNEKK